MKGLAEIILSLCDLAEAEGRLALENAYRAAAGCAMLLVAFFFMAAALAFLVGAFYAALLPLLPLPLAMAACALLCGIICASLFWSFKIWTRTRGEKKTPQTEPKKPNVA